MFISKHLSGKWLQFFQKADCLGTQIFRHLLQTRLFFWAHSQVFAFFIKYWSLKRQHNCADDFIYIYEMMGAP